MKHFILITFISLFFSCGEDLPSDLQELKLHVNDNLTNAQNLVNSKNLEDVAELKESISVLEQAFKDAKEYDKTCEQRGFKRNNSEIFQKIENQLRELKSKLSVLMSEQDELIKSLCNNVYTNKKKDMFGETNLSFLLLDNGTGKATWYWTAGERHEEGFSDLEWGINSSSIIIRYQYESDTQRTSNEKIVLNIDNNDMSCLVNENDQTEKFCK